MPKLLTPVQYESTLNGLNEIRPLQLADEAKIVLDIPVLNVNPADKDKPAIGKLLRCNDNSVLLNGLRKKDYRNYQYDEGLMTETTDEASIIFSQLVKGVLVNYWLRGFEAETLAWVNPAGRIIQSIAFEEWVWCNFSNITMLFKRIPPVGTCRFNVWGYY